MKNSSYFTIHMWDIVMDPFMSTISKGSIWKEGGGFFGVPFGNFLGWYLCVYTFLSDILLVPIQIRRKCQRPNRFQKTVLDSTGNNVPRRSRSHLCEDAVCIQCFNYNS